VFSESRLSCLSKTSIHFERSGKRSCCKHPFVPLVHVHCPFSRTHRNLQIPRAKFQTVEREKVARLLVCGGRPVIRFVTGDAVFGKVVERTRNCSGPRRHLGIEPVCMCVISILIKNGVTTEWEAHSSTWLGCHDEATRIESDRTPACGTFTFGVQQCPFGEVGRSTVVAGLACHHLKVGDAG